MWVGSLTVSFTLRMMWVDFIWKSRCHYLCLLLTGQTFHRWISQSLWQGSSPWKPWFYTHKREGHMWEGCSIQFACVQLISIFSMALKSLTVYLYLPSPEVPYLLQGINPQSLLVWQEIDIVLQGLGKGVWGFSLSWTRISKDAPTFNHTLSPPRGT